MRALLWFIIFVPILHAMDTVHPPTDTPPPYIAHPISSLPKIQKILGAGCIITLGAGGIATDFMQMILSNKHSNEPDYLGYISIFSRTGLLFSSLLLLLHR